MRGFWDGMRGIFRCNSVRLFQHIRALLSTYLVIKLRQKCSVTEPALGEARPAAGLAGVRCAPHRPARSPSVRKLLWFQIEDMQKYGSQGAQQTMGAPRRGEARGEVVKVSCQPSGGIQKEGRSAHLGLSPRSPPRCVFFTPPVSSLPERTNVVAMRLDARNGPHRQPQRGSALARSYFTPRRKASDARAPAELRVGVGAECAPHAIGSVRLVA